jgi:hypothetical protein
MYTGRWSIRIHAGRKKVWDTMLGDRSYREWTKVFTEGSYYEGSWKQGSEIHFLAPDGSGELQGMFSRIKENIEHEFLSIEHLGMISNGVIDTTSEKVKTWAPAFENYTFTSHGSSTELVVEMQLDDEHRAMFDDLWPKALATLKNLCEA